MNKSSQDNPYQQGKRLISDAGVEWMIANEGESKQPWLLMSLCGTKHKHVTKSKLKKYYTPIHSEVTNG